MTAPPTDDEIDRAIAEVGANLRTRRQELGESQETFAIRAGLARGYIGRLERGEANMSVGTIVTLARALGCEPADLLEDL